MAFPEVRIALSMIPDSISVKPVVEIYNSVKSKRDVPGRLAYKAKRDGWKAAGIQ
jgi:hypothetical protein